MGKYRSMARNASQTLAFLNANFFLCKAMPY